MKQRTWEQPIGLEERLNELVHFSTMKSPLQTAGIIKITILILLNTILILDTRAIIQIIIKMPIVIVYFSPVGQSGLGGE